MKRVHQPEKDQSLDGSSCESSDEDEIRSFCYSPQDDDQRRRFCDLVALALASSRDHGSTQTQSAPWEGDDSDSESHPSLESDAEAELLDLFDEEDENESGCCVESEPSTSPSVDSSFESYDAPVIQNRKLPLLSRQQRQRSAAFRETNSLYTNHANLLSPDLMMVVERLLKDNRRNAPKEKKRDSKPSPLSSTRESKSSSRSHTAHARSASANCEKKEEIQDTTDGAVRNATVMDHLRKLVYKKYDGSKTARSETESIRSSILPLSPSLLCYRDALRASTSAGPKCSESIPRSPKTRLEGSRRPGTPAGIGGSPTGPILYGSVTPKRSTHGGSSWVSKQRAGGPPTTLKSAESSPSSRLSHAPTTITDVVTGVMTRSMLRKSGRALVDSNSPGVVCGRKRKETPSAELVRSEPDLPSSVTTAMTPDDSIVTHAKITVDKSDNPCCNVVALTPPSEPSRTENLAVGIGMTAPSNGFEADRTG